MAVEQEFRKTIWIFKCGCRKRASSWQFQFSHRGSFDRPACLQTKNEDSGRGITTVTDKEIQSRNEARIPQNTKRQTTCSEHLTMTATLSWNRRILKTLFNFELSFWLWKSMNQHLRKSVNVAQKKRSSVYWILVIIASCLISPINICEFFLYEKLIEMLGDYVLKCKGNKSLIPLAY